ncbi:MAG: UDP-N-acetylmuramoyl-L-alanine--D-glutamate ligase [Actinomycetota bacterium]
MTGVPTTGTRTRMLVLGAAVSGTAAARLGKQLGYSVTVYDQRPATGTALMGEGIGVVNGAWDPDLLAGVGLVVASPGIPIRASAITDAREAGLPIWSEIEFAWRQLSVPVLAVTGTNGKTTVTEAATAMLVASGIGAAAVGNIGTPLSAVVGDQYELLVVEVSSFQLELTEAFHPPTAALLNISPDHLDWHTSYAAYVAAKSKIFANQTSADLLVYDVDDPGVGAVVGSAPGRRHPVSGRFQPAGGSGPSGEVLALPGLIVRLDGLTSRDPALISDLAAAAVAALDRGARPDAVEAVCRRYRPGSHRRQTVATVAGVTYVNDSKATNPHAALASIASFRTVVLIAGGLAKGLDITPLAASPNVRFLVAIGEAGPALVAHSPAGQAELVSSMSEAVAVASRMAEPGDTVLLAPGCASFDMFSDYSARGDSFAAAVTEIAVQANRKGGAA